MQQNSQEKSLKSQSSLMLGALGVVFGDIGTSPIYALRECFAHDMPPEPQTVIGIVSLIIWTIILVVAIKYVLLVMRADNKGEGSIFALTALANSGAGSGQKVKTISAISIMGALGAALFFGDSIITPAISVLSAVEGLAIKYNNLSQLVMPLSALLLFALFFVQSRGTRIIGHLFGPILLLWFLSIGFLGLRGISLHPDILLAINPYYAFMIIAKHSLAALGILGIVILVCTGAEALFADMGHFGASSIRRTWFAIVMPSLILNYLGQGALLMADPSSITSPFFLLAPDFLRMPLVILATAATVVASQAVISGAFSLAHQAIQLDVLPRLSIKHTSSDVYGQIYIPEINWLLCFGVLLLVVMFHSSQELAHAYGFAVAGTMFVTTILVAVVARKIWRWSKIGVAAVVVPFILLDGVFVIATGTKIPSGGWIPIVIAAVLFMLFITWQQGRSLVRAHRRLSGRRLDAFINTLPEKNLRRVPGLAVYLSIVNGLVPPSMLSNLQHNKVLHERIIILNVKIEDEPYVMPENRIEIRYLGQSVWRVRLFYGFTEIPDIASDLQTYLMVDCPVDMADTTFFIGHDRFIEGLHPLRPRWREKLFLWLSNNATDASEYFRIPPENIVEFGVRVDV